MNEIIIIMWGGGGVLGGNQVGSVDVDWWIYRFLDYTSSTIWPNN